MNLPDGLRELTGLAVVSAATPGGLGETSLSAVGISEESSRALRKTGLALRPRGNVPPGAVAVTAWISRLGDVRFQTGRLLVRFEAKTSCASNRAALLAQGALIVHEFRGGRLFSVRPSPSLGGDPGTWCARLGAVTGVRSARPVWLRPTPGRSPIFDDPLLKEQWAWRNTGQTGGEPGADVNVFPVWKKGVTGAGVRVAVIDLTFDLGHEDLVRAFDLGASGAYSEDLAGGVAFTTPCPSVTNDSHGTNVAGLLGARADNGKGGCGVAPGAILVPISLPAYAGVDTFLRALRFAADPTEEPTFAGSVAGADILSCSIGWSGAIDDDVREELQRLRSTPVPHTKRRGRLLVWAGPHADSTITTSTDGIAASDLVLTVGRSSACDLRLPCGYGDHLDVLAPGENVLTTHPMDSELGPYVATGHTSMAAPIAAGVAALALQVNPVLGAVALERVVCGTCKKIGGSEAHYDAEGHDAKYGWGRVDAAAAVRKAKEILTALERSGKLQPPARVGRIRRTHRVREARPHGGPGGIGPKHRKTRTNSKPNVKTQRHKAP